jgi:hypothetical protein
MATKVPMAKKVPMATKVKLQQNLQMATKSTYCTKFNPRGLASYEIWACLIKFVFFQHRNGLDIVVVTRAPNPLRNSSALQFLAVHL